MKKSTPKWICLKKKNPNGDTYAVCQNCETWIALHLLPSWKGFVEAHGVCKSKGPLK